MKKKYSLILDDEFIQFCELNNIKDIEKYAKEIFDKSFTLVKYPKTPIEKKQEPIKKLEEINHLEDSKLMSKVSKIFQEEKDDLYDE
jgi:hypothetical protein